jgi:uncharacterized protein YegP (UPF0339 family)
VNERESVTNLETTNMSMMLKGIGENSKWNCDDGIETVHSHAIA